MLFVVTQQERGLIIIVGLLLVFAIIDRIERSGKQ